MQEQLIEVSKKFWKALEKADTATMRAQCDPKCYFVHIGGNCNLDKEMEAFDNKVFQPTEIKLNQQEVKEFGDTAIVITDCDYGLLLDGAPTTHHFAVTEVYQLSSACDSGVMTYSQPVSEANIEWAALPNQGEEWKLIQFTFTALVY